MKKASSKTLTPTQKSELKRLQALTDNDIDTRDIPELRDWAGGRRGVFFRPIKQHSDAMPAIRMTLFRGGLSSPGSGASWS